MQMKTEWLGYRTVKKLWRYVKPFSSDTGTLRTDERTDRRTDLLYQYRASVCWRAIKTIRGEAIWKTFDDTQTDTHTHRQTDNTDINTDQAAVGVFIVQHFTDFIPPSSVLWLSAFSWEQNGYDTHTHGLQVCTGHWLQSLSSIQESLASMGARRNFYKVQPSLSSPFLLFSFPSLPLRSPPPFPIHPFLSSLLHCAVPYLPRSVNPLNPATDFGWTESGSEYSIYSFQWGKVPYAPAWGRPCRALKTRERKTWD